MDVERDFLSEFSTDPLSETVLRLVDGLIERLIFGFAVTLAPLLSLGAEGDGVSSSLANS